MYYFLKASLPGLMFGKEPGLSMEEFDTRCAEELSAERMACLRKVALPVPRPPETGVFNSRLMTEFAVREQYLRTRIAERRSSHANLCKLPDPAEYFPEIDHAVAIAASADEPLEREKIIDRLRWQIIDELDCGDEFGFEALCAYRLKLAILEKYSKLESGKGKENFNGAVDRISAMANE